MDPKLSLIIQFSGVFFISILLLFLGRYIRSTALSYWKIAWASMAFALAALHITITYNALGKGTIFFYYLGEYIFGYFLIAGCRNYSSNTKINSKHWLFLIPAVLVSVFLAFSVADFKDIYKVHSFLFGSMFLVAALFLRKCKISSDNFGCGVIKGSLLLMALDFFHYAVIFTLRDAGYKTEFFEAFVPFNTIIDLILEIMLGFGMVIVLLEQVKLEVVETNNKLIEANEQLEEYLQTDPLTAVFNRHAFYSFLKKRKGQSLYGCTGIFDIDDLKPINDEYGHPTGDMVISCVANGIRRLIRADDMLFRWGGDEFCVIMMGLDKDNATNRMQGLRGVLDESRIREKHPELKIRVSIGFANFSNVDELETAIENADARMYEHKKVKKAGNVKDESILIPPDEKTRELKPRS